MRALPKESLCAGPGTAGAIARADEGDSEWTSGHRRIIASYELPDGALLGGRLRSPAVHYSESDPYTRMWPARLAFTSNTDHTKQMTEHPRGQRSLTDYLEIIGRRKWLAIVPLVLVPLAAYVYSVQQPTVYASSADVLLTRQDLGSTLSGITNADVFTDPDRFAETQASLARVPEVARRAVARSAVSDYSAGDLLASSDVTPRGNADLLGFTVRHGDPTSAGDLATAYAEAYTDYRLELDTVTLASARKDLQRTMRTLESEGSTDTALYRELAQKVQDLRTRELLQMRARVVRPAGLGWQVAPTPVRNAFLGVVVGC